MDDFIYNFFRLYYNAIVNFGGGSMGYMVIKLIVGFVMFFVAIYITLLISTYLDEKREKSYKNEELRSINNSDITFFKIVAIIICLDMTIGVVMYGMNNYESPQDKMNRESQENVDRMNQYHREIDLLEKHLSK